VGLTALEDAQRRVLAGCVPLHPRAVPLDDALGCVTSVALTADEAVPPFANTAMDGYAVRAADTSGAPVTLRVAGTLAAGADPSRVHVEPGTAVRIMTGAAIPAGADAIVMVERTTASADGSAVTIADAATTGDHVRPAGEDIAPGDEVFPARTLLTAGHLGVLASLGYVNVPVYPRPRVGVLSTGDELVDGPVELRPGQIRDSNRHTLLALVRLAGCEPVDLGLARDDEAVISSVIESGVASCDALVTSGGVSVGDFDYVKAVLDRLGRMQWMQVAIKPAKPLAFGTIGAGDRDVPVFGLPGNPVSSMVSFELFARPGLRQLMGFPPDVVLRRPVRGVAGEPLRRRSDGKTHFVRVVASVGDDGRYRVVSSGGQASNLLRAMALANALAVVPDGDGVEAGADVDVLLLNP
jgi:molybdenum cofactor synthesis domain-containing protein